MSEDEFELYLRLLGKFLRLKPGQRAEISDELRDHLESRLDELTQSGLDRTAAIARFESALTWGHVAAQLRLVYDQW